MSLPIIIVGGGGHAKVLIDSLKLQKKETLGIVERPPYAPGEIIGGVPILGNDEFVFRYKPDEILLINGLGSAGLPERRQEIHTRFRGYGYRFETVQHPSAIVASDVHLGEGVQIMAGAIVQTGSRIGQNVILNTSSSVDHDCMLGEHVHIAPGVTLSGNVHVGDGSHIGTGATVIQGVKIGRGVIIAAGAVVVSNVLDRVMVMGVPAREVKR